MQALTMALVACIAQAAPQDDELQVLRPGESISGVIADGDQVVTSVALDGYVNAPTVGRAFEFEVKQAGAFHVDLRSCLFDTYLVLRDDSGDIVAEDDDGLVGTHSRVVFEAQAGQRLHVVACALHGSRGAFELSLEMGRPPVLDAAALQASSIVELKHCLDVQEKAVGPEHPDVAYTLNNLTNMLRSGGDIAGALPLQERAVAILEKTRPRHPSLANGLSLLAMLRESMGEHVEARRLHERALAIQEETLGPGHLVVANSLSLLAAVLQAQGDYAGARPPFERALAIQEETLGPGHLVVANSLSLLGGLLQAQGDYAGARPLFDRALAIREKALGLENLKVANSLNNLTNLLKAQGDYAGALKLSERELEIREAALGPEHPDVAMCLDNVGVLLRDQGDNARARALYERALAIQEKALGPGHLALAWTLENLGTAMGDQGDYARARPLIERALAIREKEQGPDHPDVAVSLSQLATLLMDQGDYTGSRPLHERALAIREKSLGPDHRLVASSLVGIGNLLTAQGDYAGARPLYERASAIFLKALGPEHPVVATGMNNLASLLQFQGDFSGARPLYERALAISKKALGPDHPDVATGLNNLASLLHGQGDYAAARPLFEQALAIHEKKQGAEDLNVAICLNNLAALLVDQGDYAGARPLHERALAIHEGTLGHEHPFVATSLNNLAILMRIEGDDAGARPLFERALAIREKSLGPDHPDVAGCLGQIALILSSRGDFAGARPLVERALAIRERSLGLDHPDVAYSLVALGDLLRASGDDVGARPLYERALAIRENALGPDHPDVVAHTKRLAVFELDCGAVASAIALLEKANAEETTFLSRFVSAASDSEAGDYVATIRWQIEFEQSPAVAAGRPVLAYENLLAWKGQILRAARASRSALRERLGPEARSLADHLHEVSAALSRSATNIGHGDQRFDGQRLDALNREYQQSKRELAELTAGILPRVPAWPELRAALPAHAALIDVFIHRIYEPAISEGTRIGVTGSWSEPRVSAWVTRFDSTAPKRVDLGPAAMLQSAVDSLLLSLAGQRGELLGPHEDANDMLRCLAWDPLVPYLTDIDMVIVAPDGVMAQLPLESLRNDKGLYLCEDRSFVYLTDPTELARMSAQPASHEGALLAVGGVDYSRADVDAPVEHPSLSGEDFWVTPAFPASATDLPRGSWSDIWSPLAATEAEARRVAARHGAAFPDSKDLVIVGPAASEERLKALLPEHATLHLATHGYFNPEGLPSIEDAARRDLERHRDDSALSRDPAADVARRFQGYSPGVLSGLVCAGANANLQEPRDDGYLTAEEVGWLDLSHVDLVVLSACDTGRGRAQSGEGLIGLRRSFLLAGAKSVVSSLWAVPDQETAELMDLFYRNLWQKRLGRHAALRAAQLEIIDRNRKRFDGDARPVTWGAFVLDGDWR